MSRLAGFALAAVAVSLVAAMGVSYLASPAPDGLESAVLTSQCDDAPDQERCLARAAGDPVYTGAPQGLADYEVGWLSGLIGVGASFGVGAGLLALAGRARRRADEASSSA